MLGFYSYILWVIGNAISSFLTQKTVSSKKKKKRRLLGICLTLFLLIISLQTDIDWRVREAWNKLQSPRSYTELPPILKGMRLNSQVAKSYEEITVTMNNYFTQNPQSNLITNGKDALYLLFTDNSSNIHPLYINWGEANTIMYKNYNDIVSKYIENNHPLIVGRDWSLTPSGYGILQTVGGVNIFAPLIPVSTFIIANYAYNLSDTIGKLGLSPDGIPDSKIEILFDRPVSSSISRIVVEHRDSLNNITSRWDTMPATDYWLAGIFHENEFIASKKMDNLQLIVEKGTRLWLILNGNLSGVGDVDITIGYNDGTFSRQSLLINCN